MEGERNKEGRDMKRGEGKGRGEGGKGERIKERGYVK